MVLLSWLIDDPCFSKRWRSLILHETDLRSAVSVSPPQNLKSFRQTLKKNNKHKKKNHKIDYIKNGRGINNMFLYTDGRVGLSSVQIKTKGFVQISKSICGVYAAERQSLAEEEA